jgi:hypothetical protein
VKQGTPCRMIPAFSRAIRSKVSPSSSMWSKPRLLMPVLAWEGSGRRKQSEKQQESWCLCWHGEAVVEDTC